MASIVHPTDHTLPTDSTRLGAVRVAEVVAMILVVAAVVLPLVDLDRNQLSDTRSLLKYKLAMCGCCGLFGIYAFFKRPGAQRFLFAFPGLWLVLIGGCYLLSSVFSINPQRSFASTVSYTSMVLFSITATDWLGRRKMLISLMVGLLSFVGVSVVLYFLIPEIGRFNEALGGGHYKTRMAGLAHPNAVGYFAALLLGVSVAAGRIGYFSWRWLAGPILISVLALALTYSRTAILAAGLAVLVAHADLLRTRNGFIASLVAIAGGVTTILVLSLQYDLTALVTEGLLKVSKSGDLREIASATGRVEIWAYTIQCISESPMVGYGPTTSQIVLRDHLYSAHNLVLSMMLGSGVACGLFMILMGMGRLLKTITHPSKIPDVIVIIVLAVGLLEASLFYNIPSAPTMLWTLALMWRCYEDTDE